jgi:hypothetical protein
MKLSVPITTDEKPVMDDSAAGQRHIGLDRIQLPPGLAAKMPAAVLADLLHLSPGTAVRWVHQAGGDWSRYAAELARERVHQT